MKKKIESFIENVLDVIRSHVSPQSILNEVDVFSKFLLTAVFDAFCLFVPVLSLGKFSNEKLWYYLFSFCSSCRCEFTFYKRRKQKPFPIYRLLIKYNFLLDFVFVCVCDIQREWNSRGYLIRYWRHTMNFREWKFLLLILYFSFVCSPMNQIIMLLPDKVIF